MVINVLKTKALEQKKNIVVLYLAFKHHKTPLYAKIVIGITSIVIALIWILIIYLIVNKIVFRMHYPDQFYTYIMLFAGGVLAASISGAAGFGGALLLLPLLTKTLGTTLAIPVLTIA